MNASPFNVGAFVPGAPTSPRALVRHAELLNAYADGAQAEKGDDREAYLSHFAFGPEMQSHYSANRQSVAGFAGACWCRWLVLDIDRADLVEALADARRLVRAIHERYPELEGKVPIYFSGGKGFHVLLELAHNPPPAVGFHRVARTLAEALAARAGAKIDAGVYDANRIIRLPNTRHPKTGLFKRRIDADTLFALGMPGILDLAKHPSGDGMPSINGPVPQLETDWHEAEGASVRTLESRAVVRRDFGTAEPRAPRYLLDLLRFGVDEGERHQTVFRCSAWLTEQGGPPSLVFALLTEPARDVGLSPKDAGRQIQCGIDHVRRPSAEPVPVPSSPPPDEDLRKNDPPQVRLIAPETAPDAANQVRLNAPETQPEDGNEVSTLTPDPTPDAAVIPLADLESRVRRAGLTWERIRDHFDTAGDYCPIAGTLAGLTGRQRANVWALAGGSP